MNGLMLSICIYMYIEKTSNEFLSAKKDMLMLSGRPNQLSATGCTAAKRLHCDGDARELGCYLEMCNKQTLNSSRCRSGAQKPWSLMEFVLKAVQKKAVMQKWGSCYGYLVLFERRDPGVLTLESWQMSSVQALPNQKLPPTGWSKGNVAFRNQCWHVSMPSLKKKAKPEGASWTAEGPDFVHTSKSEPTWWLDLMISEASLFWCFTDCSAATENNLHTQFIRLWCISNQQSLPAAFEVSLPLSLSLCFVQTRSTSATSIWVVSATTLKMKLRAWLRLSFLKFPVTLRGFNRFHYGISIHFPSVAVVFLSSLDALRICASATRWAWIW